MGRTDTAINPVVVLKKLSYEDLKKHGYTLKVCGNISGSQFGFTNNVKKNIEKEPQQSSVENEVPHFPSWKEGSIVWGRTLNSPWWPGVVCAPPDGQGNDIPGCAWLQWPHFSEIDVVCNASIIDFKEGYSKCVLDKCTYKGYQKGLLTNIKAVARKSGIDITNWTRSKLLKWASNGFKRPAKGQRKWRKRWPMWPNGIINQKTLCLQGKVHPGRIYNTRSRKFNINYNEWIHEFEAD